MERCSASRDHHNSSLVSVNTNTLPKTKNFVPNKLQGKFGVSWARKLTQFLLIGPILKDWVPATESALFLDPNTNSRTRCFPKESKWKKTFWLLTFEVRDLARGVPGTFLDLPRTAERPWRSFSPIYCQKPWSGYLLSKQVPNRVVLTHLILDPFLQ